MMADPCRRDFDEALLSGYLDQALPQMDEQRVRVHLEDCVSCRSIVDEMRRLREVTMQTQFDVPRDDQWSEMPRTRASRLSMSAGWTVVILWLIGVGGYAGLELARSDEPWLAKVLAFGGWTGLGFLLLGVGLDRLKVMRTDRYRGIER